MEILHLSCLASQYLEFFVYLIVNELLCSKFSSQDLQNGTSRWCPISCAVVIWIPCVIICWLGHFEISVHFFWKTVRSRFLLHSWIRLRYNHEKWRASCYFLKGIMMISNKKMSLFQSLLFTFKMLFLVDIFNSKFFHALPDFSPTCCLELVTSLRA